MKNYCNNPKYWTLRVWRDFSLFFCVSILSQIFFFFFFLSICLRKGVYKKKKKKNSFFLNYKKKKKKKKHFFFKQYVLSVKKSAELALHGPALTRSLERINDISYSMCWIFDWIKVQFLYIKVQRKIKEKAKMERNEGLANETIPKYNWNLSFTQNALLY